MWPFTARPGAGKEQAYIASLLADVQKLNAAAVQLERERWLTQGRLDAVSHLFPHLMPTSQTDES